MMCDSLQECFCTSQRGNMHVPAWSRMSFTFKVCVMYEI